MVQVLGLAKLNPNRPMYTPNQALVWYALIEVEEVQDAEPRNFREVIESMKSKTLKLVELPEKPRVVRCKEIFKSTQDKSSWRGNDTTCRTIKGSWMRVDPQSQEEFGETLNTQ